MLELEQLLAQGCNKVAVGRIAVDFESVVVVVVVVVVASHCFVSYLVSRGVALVCQLCAVCLLGDFNKMTSKQNRCDGLKKSQ